MRNHLLEGKEADLCAFKPFSKFIVNMARDYFVSGWIWTVVKFYFTFDRNFLYTAMRRADSDICSISYKINNSGTKTHGPFINVTHYMGWFEILREL